MRSELAKTDHMWYITNHCRTGSPGNQRGQCICTYTCVHTHTHTDEYTHVSYSLGFGGGFFVGLFFVIVLGKIHYPLLFISS